MTVDLLEIVQITVKIMVQNLTLIMIVKMHFKMLKIWILLRKMFHLPKNILYWITTKKVVS